MKKLENWFEPFVNRLASTPQPPRRAPSRVLLADDDDDMREILTAALISDGYEVSAARDGLEMLSHLQQALDMPLSMPDVIVMDFVMPRYSGLNVLGALRRANWLTPVIMMSGVADENVREEAKGLGVTTFLWKPFNIDDLRTAIVNAALMSGRNSMLPL